ncbi:Hypothetical predicted protein [Paramuricea clavata]|uniref:Uncharacterized protein n=1 Tax=Paramuricea clavata TaxID=317549 RepID=A0A7D9JS06_PARCT|nr:Hypothetical predicted protein [Paramuricea clavata]
MEDRLHAVKMVARSKDVNIDYTSTTTRKARKRKRSSQIGDKTGESGPPDKLRHIRDSDKERPKEGQALIHSTVMVEYQEKDGETLIYLGWLVGTIKSYNKRKGGAHCLRIVIAHIIFTWENVVNCREMLHVS